MHALRGMHARAEIGTWFACTERDACTCGDRISHLVLLQHLVAQPEPKLGSGLRPVALPVPVPGPNLDPVQPLGGTPWISIATPRIAADGLNLSAPAPGWINNYYYIY